MDDRLEARQAKDEMPPGLVLDPSFFARPSDEVGRDLVGKVLWRAGLGGGRLTEVEAYLPSGDPACHASSGRTPRNASMFGPPGCIYVYRSYGVHVLLNLVCDAVGLGSAVLVRSFEPLNDTRLLRQNRGIAEDGDPRAVSCGPGRVGRALGLRLDLDGLLLGGASGLYVIDDGARPDIGVATRVGISRGEELLLRYYMRGSRFVSRAPRAI